jgi:hypothetical protein
LGRATILSGIPERDPKTKREVNKMALKCILCEAVIGGHIDNSELAEEAGWVPYFYCDKEEYSHACSHCAGKYLQLAESGEMEIKPEFRQTFLDSASSNKYDEPLAKMKSALDIYPNRELIKKLRGKFLEHTFKSLSSDEAIDLINHQHQLIADLDHEIENLEIELQSHYDDF